MYPNSLTSKKSLALYLLLFKQTAQTDVASLTRSRWSIVYSAMQVTWYRQLLPPFPKWWWWWYVCAMDCAGQKVDEIQNFEEAGSHVLAFFSLLPGNNEKIPCAVVFRARWCRNSAKKREPKHVFLMIMASLQLTMCQIIFFQPNTTANIATIAASCRKEENNEKLHGFLFYGNGSRRHVVWVGEWQFLHKSAQWPSKNPWAAIILSCALFSKLMVQSKIKNTNTFNFTRWRCTTKSRRDRRRNSNPWRCII